MDHLFLFLHSSIFSPVLSSFETEAERIGYVTMGAATRSEEGVLKLVHPGRYVEIHRSPVVASKIMEENPRHFVTRPDVFRFPWIVVRPESMLMPGKVFYIVPCHTLYRLVRERGSPVNHRPSAPKSAMMAVKSEGAKSCLKKQSCSASRASRGRRVVFILPDNRMAIGGGD